MIRILHHHLRRGGVTQVMYASAGILRDAGEAVEIWSGEPATALLPDGVGFRHHPGLAYRADFSDSDCQDLIRDLRNCHKDGDIWHVHNHSLGKSPVVSAAICALAAQGLPLVLQIHDFAEDGRPANLNLLRDTLPGGLSQLYPVGPNVVYAVLQARDRDVLLGAGVPSGRIVLLPNPISGDVKIPPPAATPKRILYLTRAIRRKNIGELIYWAKALSAHFEFATSLIPENPAEKPNFDAWVSFCESEQIPVKWGLGLCGKSFSSLLSDSDACITTSMGEGFGMSFLEPYAMGRRVLGRDLPPITAGFKQDGVQLSHLYPALPVPADALDAAFWSRAHQAVSQWRRRMGLSVAPAQDALPQAWVHAGQIDFGRLDETAQRHLLKTLPLSGQQAEDLLCGSGSEMPENQRVIAEHYHPDTYGRRLQDLYALPGSGRATDHADADKVRDAFSDLRTLSLLRI